MTPDAQAILANVPVFATLSAGEQREIAALSKVQRFNPKDIVVEKGDPANALFVLASGRLKALAPGEEGRDAVHSIMGPGQVFGDVALFDGGVRSATVLALEKSVCLVLERERFLVFLEHSPKVSIKLLGVLAGLVRRLSERVEDSAFLEIPARLAKRLIELAREHGRPVGDGVRIDVRLSQQDLGEMIGATRESVNKQMRAWELAGVLSKRDGRTIIHKLDELKTSANAD